MRPSGPPEQDPVSLAGTSEHGVPAESVLARVTAELASADTPAGPSSPSTPAPGEASLADAREAGGPATIHPSSQQPNQPTSGPGGPDGPDIESEIAAYLDYLSNLAERLGVPDPVEEYFAPVVGRWSDLHAEAERWREVGKSAAETTESLSKPLGGLDAAWSGADADSFVNYMQRMNLAGRDLSDAMTAMSDVLDKTADGLREIVIEMATVLVDGAESTSSAMTVPTHGDDRARQYLDQLRRPTGDLFEAVRQVLESFVRLCDGMDGGAAFDKIQLNHTVPEQNWKFDYDSPTGPDRPKDQDLSTLSGGGGGGGGGLSGGGGSFAGGGADPVPAAGGRPSPGGYVLAGETGRPAEPAAAAPAASAASGSSSAPTGRGGMGMGMMPMGMGMGGGQGGDQEHRGSSRVVGDPADIFGKPEKTSPAVIGEEEDRD